MTDKERDEILLDLKEHNKVQDEMLLDLKEHNKIQDEMLLDLKEQHKVHEQTLLEMKELMLKMQEDDKRRDEVMADMQQEIRSISRSVARIEVEHGGKIQLLLDVVCGHIDKLDEHEVRFKSDEEILNNHGLRLDILEEKAANL